jgi:hypothetical protein
VEVFLRTGSDADRATRPARRARAATLALAALLLSCGGSRDAHDARLAEARDRALAWFGREVHGVDPGWSNLFGYMHRRFGLEARDADGVALQRAAAATQRPEIAAVYRRLADPAAGVDGATLAGLDSAIDRMTGLALHCDRLGLPADWPEVLRRATAAGGYALTHAALAAEWTLENGCRPFAEIAPVQHEQVDRLAALAADRASLETTFRAPTDLFLEALAMLYYLRAGSRVEPAWIDAVLDAQRPDGGWPLHPDAHESDPHATALALWVLLENLQPDAPPIRWIP